MALNHQDKSGNVSRRKTIMELALATALSIVVFVLLAKAIDRQAR
jgi:hypothetical protein